RCAVGRRPGRDLAACLRAEALLRPAAPERDRRAAAAPGARARPLGAGAPGAADSAAAVCPAAAQHEPEPALAAQPARLPERPGAARRPTRATGAAATAKLEPGRPAQPVRNPGRDRRAADAGRDGAADAARPARAALGRPPRGQAAPGGDGE